MKLYSPSLLGIMNAVNDPNISIPKKQLKNPNFHSGQYILKEADKFGLKREELEYMGLTGYLESDKAKRSKMLHILSEKKKHSFYNNFINKKRLIKCYYCNFLYYFQLLRLNIFFLFFFR